MTGAIPPLGGAYQAQASESPEERQKLFEIQFETTVLGIYIAVSGLDGSCQQQLSHLKNEIESGTPAEKLVEQINQLIEQINQTIIPTKAHFPPFQFTTEGSQVQALTHHAITLEKCLNTLSEYGHFPWPQEQPLFAQLTNLIHAVSQLSSSQAFDQINTIITNANAKLSRRFQIPPFIAGAGKDG